MPGQAVAAMDERIVPVSQCKDVGIAEVGWIAGQSLPGDPGQLVAANEEKLRRVGVVGLNRARIPDRTLRTGSKRPRLICRSRVSQEDIVLGALINPGQVKLTDIESPVSAGSIEGAIALTGTGYSYAAGSEKVGWPKSRPCIYSHTLQPQAGDEKTLAEVDICVITSSQQQPRRAVCAAHQRRGKAAMIIFGMAHEFDAELV